MSKPTLPKINPEIEEDLVATWLNIDEGYKITKVRKYQNYKQRYLQLYPTFFMTLHTNYLNFINFVTKNAIAATAICLVALTAVSASAAQLVAPTEYKPTTLASNFFANQQKDKNPYTALKPDENNDVAISNECDLAIKYPKIFDGKTVSVDKNEYLTETEAQKMEYLYIRPNQNVAKNPLLKDLLAKQLVWSETMACIFL